MTITQALESIKKAPPAGEPFTVRLACAFTPLHLKTLLTGHLQARMPAHRVSVADGIFGDLYGSIQLVREEAALVIALEWQDLDGRLRYREGGRWGRELQDELIENARVALGRIEDAIAQVPQHVSIAISMPSLPLLPVFHAPSYQSGPLELALRNTLAEFSSRLALQQNVSVLSEQWLAQVSPWGQRFDLKSELLIGFPYTLPHADLLAAGFALQVAPRQPIKGIITDLDNTLWGGLVGEAGPGEVRWNPASKYYLHGLYQKMLGILANEGVLIAIASKNDAAVAGEALDRKDLLINKDQIFPAEIHWFSKSESVGRILQTWNIAADSVVFIDDTPLELAEVAAHHPGIKTMQFPLGDPSGVWKLINDLREMAGKSRVSQEDALRLQSIRQGSAFLAQSTVQSSPDIFLSTVQAVLELDFEGAASDPRSLELINKTNQFNLNGVRLTAAEWQGRMREPDAFALGVKYEDKFGALGTIAVVQGRLSNGTLHVLSWVLSCRAFSRRIEHQILKQLFQHFGVSKIQLEYFPTAKNGPVREFLEMAAGYSPQGAANLTLSDFDAFCPALYHSVEEVKGATLNG